MTEVWIGIVFVGVIAAIWVLNRVGTVTVVEYQRGLRYDLGRFSGVLDPGRYRYWRPRTVIHPVDIRARHVSVPGQEVMSADGITLRVTLAAVYEIADVERSVNAAQDSSVALYTDLQLALRSLIGAVPIDDVLAGRGEFGARLMEQCVPRAELLGLRLLQVDVRDIMFPGDLKRVFAQVVAAQKEGLAALERARGESAALRNLANAAQAVTDNPALLQLRLLQQLGNTTGNTVVLSLGGDPTIVPPPRA